MSRHRRTLSIKTLPLVLPVLFQLGCDVPEGADVESPTDSTQQSLSAGGLNSQNVLVCTDSNFQGTCRTIALGNHRSLSALGLGNDNISSFKTGGSVRLSLCKDGDFGGTCQTFGAGEFVSDMSKTKVGNDAASSARVVSITTPRCDLQQAPPTGFVFMYEDPGFSGDCVAVRPLVNRSWNELGIENDSVSSVWIGPGIKTVRLFRDRDPRSTSFQDLNGQASSARKVESLSPFNFDNVTSAATIW